MAPHTVYAPLEYVDEKCDNLEKTHDRHHAEIIKRLNDIEKELHNNDIRWAKLYVHIFWAATVGTAVGSGAAWLLGLFIKVIAKKLGG